MSITDDYSISHLFMEKKVTIFDDKKPILTVNLKTIRDFFTDRSWNGVYHILVSDRKEWLSMFSNVELEEPFEYLKLLVFHLGQYKQYSDLVNSIIKYLGETIDNLHFDFKEKMLIANGVTITPQIWNYIVYLLKLSQGERVTQPRTFSSPEERAFYLKQMEYEEKIKKIKQDAKNDKDGIIKMCLYITYCFPSLTLDYLFNQTMAQIYWLQKIAAESVSYSFNEKAFAAGNVKKGKKLDFFIK